MHPTLGGFDVTPAIGATGTTSEPGGTASRAAPPDRVECAFVPATIGGTDRLRLADTSHISTREGWLYLAIVRDGYIRPVVGWALVDNLQTKVVLAALRLAVHRQRPAAGLIHHSDRGCQYAFLAFDRRCGRSGSSHPPARSGATTRMPSPNHSSPHSNWTWSSASTGRLLRRHRWPSSTTWRSGIVANACIPRRDT